MLGKRTTEVKKEGRDWKGRSSYFGKGNFFSSDLIPSSFARTVGHNPVGGYLLRLYRETPVIPKIIGVEAFLE